MTITFLMESLKEIAEVCNDYFNFLCEKKEDKDAERELESTIVSLCMTCVIGKEWQKEVMKQRELKIEDKSETMIIPFGKTGKIDDDNVFESEVLVKGGKLIEFFYKTEHEITDKMKYEMANEAVRRANELMPDYSTGELCCQTGAFVEVRGWWKVKGMT